MSGDSVIDVAGLREALLQDLRAAWQALRAAAPGERIYSFAVYTGGEWSYLLATGNTEEGLRRAAGDEPDRIADYRWSYADSEFHDELPSLAGAERFLRDSNELPDEEFERYCDLVCGCCVEALARLDAEGVFGGGEDRAALVLNVVMGDQSEELWEAGLAELNPPEVVERYSRLQGVAAQARQRTAGLDLDAQAGYWVAQFVECAEGDLWHPATTSDGFERGDVERELQALGVAAAPVIVDAIERAVLRPDSFEDRAEGKTGFLSATPALRVFDLVWVLDETGEVQDEQVERLVTILRTLVERDSTLEKTHPSAENLARVLHGLRPDRFPRTQLDPKTNHLRNAAEFL